MKVKLIILGIFSINYLFSQTSDNQYIKPLKDILDEIGKRYQVTIDYQDKQVADKYISYAEWRFRPDVEKTLSNVLSPVDLMFQKEGKNKYKIKNYEYYRWPLEDALEKAEYLATIYNDSTTWSKRKTELRECMWEALQLKGIPTWPKSKPITSNFRKMNGYTIENIALEVLPGVYTFASIYRPIKSKDKCPVIICPNGHWNDARYRPDNQYLCATLASMGAIVASHDLFAWGESMLQFPYETHRRSLAMTIQVLNTFRILDYLLSLEDSDQEKIGIVGGSGGGSHSMLIAALDDRIKLSVPTVMLSCYMYGGCPCESGMPIHLCGKGTNNIELSAMAAPRPQLIISDGKDWTANVPEIEYPLVKRIYSFYNKEFFVENAHFADEGHDFGLSKRMAVYPFIAKHFQMDIKKITDNSGNISESKITIEDKEAMYVIGNKAENLPVNAIKSFEELEKILQEKPKNKYMSSRRKFLQKTTAIATTGLILPGLLMSVDGKNKKSEKKPEEIKYKIAVCDWMILKRQKLGAFKRSSEIGADGVEVDIGGLGQRDTFENVLLDPIERKKFKDEASKYNLIISSIAMSGFYAQSFAERETVSLMLRDTINTMELMDVKVAFLPLGVKSDLVKYPELRQAVVERLKIAGQMAEASGVVIGIETAYDATEEAKLIDEVASPGIKSYFNFANALQNGRDLYQEIKILGKDRICQIHCTDEDGVWLENNKRLDMMKVKQVLDEIGWSGWLVIERSRDASNSGDVVGNFGANTRYLKSIFQ